jgi:hypothetical protein
VQNGFLIGTVDHKYLKIHNVQFSVYLLRSDFVFDKSLSEKNPGSSGFIFRNILALRSILNVISIQVDLTKSRRQETGQCLSDV